MASGNPSSPSGATHGTGTQSGQGPGPGRPVQLVRLDEEGGLTLDEEALSRCLEQGGVEGAPVCLVSVIGEQRRGKSFLLNCLLRQLRSPEAADTSWMEQENQAPEGFECRAGKATVTKGVWMWDQPLWVQAQGRKVAVFLVDTEGCLDLQRHMETSIKLSVFSILLSSYWMFLQVAKEVGETCNLPPLQPLDLLVRDWQLSEPCGVAGGQEYLRDITRDPKHFAEHSWALGALRARGTRCYLLPHPGKKFTRSGMGLPGDMDEDFRQCLCDYVSTVARAAGTHVRTDRAGMDLTGAKLAARIKAVARYLKTKTLDFSSPVKMAESLAVGRKEENSKAIEDAEREYEQFVQELDRGHRSTRSCLRVKPMEMQLRLEARRWEVMQSCQGKLWGQDPQRQAALEELKEELDRQMELFLVDYKLRFRVAETEENKRAVEAARKEYEQFVQELDRDHQSMSSILRVMLVELQRLLEGKRQELRARCWGELGGEAPQRQAALQALEEELDKQAAQFLSAYEQRFRKAPWRCVVQ